MKEFTNFHTILFDLDGTLSDSKLGIIRCLQYSLAKFGITETDTEKLTRCIGPSLSFTYREWYGLNEADALRAIGYYRERFEREGIRENALFVGVAELLEALHKNGKRLALATAKPTVHARRILEYADVASLFATMAGSNLDGTREDKGEIIGIALAELEKFDGADRGGIVMVGDRRHDIVGAKQNGLASIGVLYGYGDRAELEAAGADDIVQSVAALRALLLGNC